MEDEVTELHSIPPTPPPEAAAAANAHSRPPVSAPPSQLHSPSLTRSPLLPSATPRSATPRTATPRTATPRTPRTPGRFMRTPLASPMRKAVVSMRGYLEEIGHLTKLDPQDAWLPITESRNGNAYYSAFHTLTSGIGFQALILPVAFTYLGW